MTTAEREAFLAGPHVVVVSPAGEQPADRTHPSDDLQDTGLPLNVLREHGVEPGSVTAATTVTTLAAAGAPACRRRTDGRSPRETRQNSSARNDNLVIAFQSFLRAAAGALRVIHMQQRIDRPGTKSVDSFHHCPCAACHASR
ncbi:hypothetical protein [Streptomyces decoyicus]|uniref:hypothetical protein n=1 Tax=Streptomyces decoyicus TaxID=249567 RepID=UPI0033AACCCD